MNSIHPSALVGAGVELGTGNVIGPGAVLFGPLRVGDDNWIGPGVTIGTPPEVRGVPHRAQWLEPGEGHPGGGYGVRIGSRNVIREQTLVHQGWGRATVIGNDCFIMNKVYIAHDSELGDGVTLASTVTMGGHVAVGSAANIGLGAVVHQRRVVGPGAMVGMGSVVTHDVAPFSLVYGNPARLHGANVVGMSRSGVEETVVERIRAAYEAGVVPGAAEVPEVVRERFLWWESRLTA